MNDSRLWSICAGFTLWGAGFVLLYAAQALGCRLGWDSVSVLSGLSLQRAVLVALFLAVLAGSVALALKLRATPLRGRTARFIGVVARDAALAASGAVLGSFFAVFWLSAC